MPLYIPKLKYNARPPLYWPVYPSWRVSLKGLGIVLGLSICYYILMRIGLQYSYNVNDTSTFITFLTIINTGLLITGSFYFTANIMLKRPYPLMDRYSGYREYLKLLSLSVISLLLGIDTVSLSLHELNRTMSNTPEHHHIVSATITYTLCTLIPLFMGLHFAYGDSSPLLQG